METPKKAASRRVRTVVAFAVAAAVLLGGGFAAYHSNSREGSALSFEGPMVDMVLAPSSAKPGDLLGYAFPEIRNVSSEPVTLLSLKVTNVPRGVEVVKYRFLSSRDTAGFLLGSFPADGNDRYAYDSYRGYSHPKIAPKTKTHYYGVVYLRVLQENAADVSGCQVTYRAGSHTYTQSTRCDFRPRPVQPPKASPRT